MDPDEVALAAMAPWQHLIDSVPGAVVRERANMVLVMTGLPMSGFNSVSSAQTAVDAEVVANLLDELSSAGLPHCLQLRPGWPAAIEEIARSRGMVRLPGEPAMVLEDPALLGAAQVVEGLSVRELEPHEGGIHAGVAAAGFGVPAEPFLGLWTREVLGTPGISCYVGEVAGEPVATSVGVTAGTCVDIFGVATLPAHRSKGYGSAVTARAAADGFARGATVAWLSSSAAGFGVYERLGFRTVEYWDLWESEGPR